MAKNYQMLCFGFGYSAKEIAKQLLNSSKWKIVGTTKSKERGNEFDSLGVEKIIWPGQSLHEALSKSTHWLISIPPKDGIDPVIHYFEKNKTLLENSPVQWIGYLSTTAVYGDHKGKWVDEQTPENPKSSRGKARLIAERSWMDLIKIVNARVCIFRLAGIYGPNRGPIQQLKNGKKRKIIKKGQYFNRIHVEDIAGAVCKTIQNSTAQGIYNVCDNLPEKPDVVADYAAKLLQIPYLEGIKFEDAELSPMAKSFYGESKKVSNQKLINELNYQMKYSNYMEGFEDLVK